MVYTCLPSKISASPPFFASAKPNSVRSLQVYFFPWWSAIRWEFKGRSMKEKNSDDIEEFLWNCLSERSKWFPNSTKVSPVYFWAEAQGNPKGGQVGGWHGCHQVNMSISEGWGGICKSWMKEMGGSWIRKWKGCGLCHSPADAGAAQVVATRGAQGSRFPHAENFHAFPMVVEAVSWSAGPCGPPLQSSSEFLWQVSSRALQFPSKLSDTSSYLCSDLSLQVFLW